MVKAAPSKTKKPAAAAKALAKRAAKAPVKPAAKAKKALTKSAAAKKPAKPAAKAKKAVVKATTTKKALSKAAAKTKRVPAGALGLPLVEVTLQGQRYIVGEYGSLMTFDDYEKLMANKQQR